MKTKQLIDHLTTIDIEFPEYEFYEMRITTNLKSNERSFTLLFRKDDNNWLHVDLDADGNMTDSKFKTSMWL